MVLLYIFKVMLRQARHTAAAVTAVLPGPAVTAGCDVMPTTAVLYPPVSGSLVHRLII